jgi:polyhydroxyalkanoate synthesis regulator phasin
MYGVMKKAVLAGLGVRAKVNEVVDELVRKGESAQDRPSLKMRELVASCEESARGVERLVKEGVDTVARVVRTPGRADIEALERQLQDLARKVESLSKNA